MQQTEGLDLSLTLMLILLVGAVVGLMAAVL
jgi:hypothetical protein